MLVCMKTLIQTLFHRTVSALRERWYLQLEHIALLHQLDVLKRSAKRPHFDPADRCLWVLLSTWWPAWPHALEIMHADTVRRWRRQGMRHHVQWRRGRKRPGRPPIAAETRKLIREMSRDNRLWGAPRIHGELAKLGINVSRTTVAKYMTRRRYPASPTWRTFICNQAPDLVLTEVYTALSGQFRAVLRQSFLRFRRWLGWLFWHGQCPLCGAQEIARTESIDPISTSITSELASAGPVKMSSRSPPATESLSTTQYDHIRTDVPT